MAQTAFTPSCSSVGSSVVVLVVLAIQLEPNPMASKADVRSVGETLAAVSTCSNQQTHRRSKAPQAVVVGEKARRREGGGGTRKGRKSMLQERT